MNWWTRQLRDFVLFVGGLAGVLHETLLSEGAERPYLLVVFAGMMGLPYFIRFDEKSRGGGSGDESS